MFYLYILKSAKYPKTYVGISGNIDKRLIEHNNNESTFTSKYVPWEVIYTERFESKKDAFKRERYFKSAAGRKKIKNIIDKFIPR